MHIVDFFNVIFNLLDETYKPYKKPDHQLLYVNKSLNDPPQIIKQLPTSINDGLLNTSSNKKLFDIPKGEYENALRESGYADKKDKKEKQNHSYNIIWFNPPLSKNFSTNVAKRLFNLIDQQFPISSKLHAISK